MKKWICLIGLVTACIRPLYAQHSYGSDSIDILHYSINLSIVDLPQHQIAGYTDVTARILPNGLYQFPLDLQQLTVDSIFVETFNIPAWDYNDTLLLIPIPFIVAQGDTIDVRVYYHGTPQIDPSTWGGFYFTSTYAYNIGVGFESNPHTYGRVWFPCTDDFQDKALFDYIITVDSGKIAVCGGNFISTSTNPDHSVTCHWQSTAPIPPYLASVAVGDYIAIKSTYYGIEADIPVRIYIPQADSLDALGSFANLNNILAAFENRFGPYKLERVGYVGVPFNAGAMEHACNIAYPLLCINGGLTYESLYAHELSHMWFGDAVTCATAEDMWVNEGWAVFCEFEFTNAIYGVDAERAYVRSKLKEVLQFAHIIDNGFRSVCGIPQEYTYGTTVYDKGGLVVHTLKHYMGDSTFYDAVKVYIDSMSYGNIGCSDLGLLLETVSGVPLGDFFDAWVLREGFPHFDVDSFDYSPIPASSDFSVNVYIRQKLFGTNTYPISNKVEITFMDSAWNEFTVLAEFDNITEELNFTVPFEPTCLIVDKKEDVADAITSYDLVWKSTGNTVLSDILCQANVTSISDSSYIRAEHHWVTPDQVISNPDIYRISPNRYWEFSGILAPGTQVQTRFTYTRVQSTSSGYLDHMLLLSTTSADSLILVYRPGPGFDWQQIPFTKVGTVNTGYLMTDFFALGEYALAIGEPYQSGIEINNQGASLQVYPNPSSDTFTFETNSAEPTKINIYDISGKPVFSERINAGSQQSYWSPINCESGYYIVELTDIKNVVINSCKIFYQKK